VPFKCSSTNHDETYCRWHTIEDMRVFIDSPQDISPKVMKSKEGYQGYIFDYLRDHVTGAIMRYTRWIP